MAATTDATLFEDDFIIEKIDSAKYDRVMRITAKSTDAATVMSLDVNLELFPCALQDHLTVVLASTLQLDGTKEDKGWRDVSSGENATLADMFEYVCYGKIYKFEDSATDGSVKSYISFGGLLMLLDGPYKKITPLRQDYVYLLIKK